MRADLPDKLDCLLILWQRYAPERKFLGQTHAEFDARREALLIHLNAMKTLDLTYTAMIATRESLASDLNLQYQRIVSLIWGDEALGPNCDFTRGLGYKTLAEYGSPSPAEPEPTPAPPTNPPA